uniref:Replication initiator protein n=2 Tax=Clostridiaceae TaxID=31979 RepID=A0AA40M1C5_CLONO|nr:putative replication initiator protein [Clostridium novyi B str. NCTC 9691]KEI11392.1 putative replication initiator protein [Clostridium novyi B str. ATCC 27606]
MRGDNGHMCIELLEDKRDKILMKNNSIVKAKYNLTTNESKVFLLMLFKMQKVNEGVLSCNITYDEFKDSIKSTRDNTIKNISNILSNLRKKPIYFKIKNNDHLQWGEFGFINGYFYNDKAKTFTIEASQKIYDVMKNYLTDGYTPNNLTILMKLRNPNAYRLYDLLRLWSGVKTKINYTIDELKEYLMLDGNYPEYGNFKRRVIVPAIKELNKTGFFEIDFKEVKQGRKVVSIDFLVKDLDKRIYFKSLEEINKEDNILESRIKPKEIVKAQEIVDNKIESILHIENKAVIKMINNKFKNYDFDLNKETVWECEIITLEKDNNIYDSINANNYKYFINTLANKINLENQNKDTFNDFPQRRYDFEELETQLLLRK